MTSTHLSEELRQRVRASSGNRCGYCLSLQRYVMGKLEIEHLIPRALGGSDDEANLWLSCGLCNRYKGFQIEKVDFVTSTMAPLFNPRTQIWREHFEWDTEGIFIKGLTPVGRATVEALQLNNEIAVEVRRNWIIAGWHPPNE